MKTLDEALIHARALRFLQELKPDMLSDEMEEIVLLLAEIETLRAVNLVRPPAKTDQGHSSA